MALEIYQYYCYRVECPYKKEHGYPNDEIYIPDAAPEGTVFRGVKCSSCKKKMTRVAQTDYGY